MGDPTVPLTARKAGYALTECRKILHCVALRCVALRCVACKQLFSLIVTGLGIMFAFV